MRYIWDEGKAAENERKHKVDFDTAMLVFADPNRIEDYDSGHSGNEDRWQTIGLADTRMLFVVYVEKRDDVIRIISARKADKDEQKTYHQINSRS
jgi:uncharacterized DUF497 family protein